MRDVLREEKKFLLNQAEALKLRNYLSNVVHTDSHNGPDGYQVRSWYFDSLSNRDFQEKEDGLELRRKFRLRVYSPDADFALFEMKQKQGPYQRKRSLRLSRREAQALIEGDYSVLLNSGSEFGQECYSIMEMWATPIIVGSPPVIPTSCVSLSNSLIKSRLKSVLSFSCCTGG